MDFAKNLKRIRTDKQMKQEDVALALNVSQKTISAWECEKAEPSMGDIAKLANILNCTQGELIGIEHKTGDITFEDLLVKVHSLSINDLEKLRSVVENQLKIHSELEKLEYAKKEHEKRLLEYEMRIAELKGLKQ